MLPLRADEGGAGGQSPKTALRDMIGLLEAKDYATFVKRFVPADVYEPAVKENKVKELESEIKAKAADLFYRLKAVKDAEPTIEDKRHATFTAIGPDGREISITVILEKKGWCLQ